MKESSQVLFERAQKAARATARSWPAVDAEDLASDLVLQALQGGDGGAWYAQEPEGKSVAALKRKAAGIASRHQSELDQSQGLWLIGDEIVVEFLKAHFSGVEVSGLYSDLFAEVMGGLRPLDMSALRSVYGPHDGPVVGAVRTRASRAKAVVVKKMNWANIAREREAGELDICRVA